MINFLSFATCLNKIFWYLADEGHIGVLKALVELVAPPESESRAKDIRQFHQFLNKPNSYGQTSLMLACKSGWVLWCAEFWFADCEYPRLIFVQAGVPKTCDYKRDNGQTLPLQLILIIKTYALWDAAADADCKSIWIWYGILLQICILTGYFILNLSASSKICVNSHIQVRSCKPDLCVDCIQSETRWVRAGMRMWWSTFFTWALTLWFQTRSIHAHAYTMLLGMVSLLMKEILGFKMSFHAFDAAVIVIRTSINWSL